PVSSPCTPWPMNSPRVDQWPHAIFRSRSARPGTEYQGYSPGAWVPGGPFSSKAMRPRGVQYRMRVNTLMMARSRSTPRKPLDQAGRSPYMLRSSFLRPLPRRRRSTSWARFSAMAVVQPGARPACTIIQPRSRPGRGLGGPADPARVAVGGQQGVAAEPVEESVAGGGEEVAAQVGVLPPLLGRVAVGDRQQREVVVAEHDVAVLAQRIHQAEGFK